MDRIETRTAQLGIVGGARQPASELIIAAEPGNPFSPEARKGRLYLLVEADPELPRAAQACQLAARTIRRVFYEDGTYSVTAGLRAAMRAANKAIYEQNVSQPAGRRAHVSCTCAVWKDGELFVAQVQPAQAYVRGEGQLRALPAHPSWDTAHVSVAPFAHSGALGASLFIEPELYRCTLRAGESAILCSSGFSHLLARADVERLVRLDDPEAIAAELERLAHAGGLAEAHALALVARPAPASARREPHGAAGERGRQPARSLGGWLGALTGGRAAGRPGDERRRATTDELGPLPEPPTHSPKPPPRPAPIRMGESLSERYERERQERERQERERPAPRRPAPQELPPSTFIGEEDYQSPPGARRIDLGDGAAANAGARPYRPRYELRPFVDLTWGERLAMPFRHAALAVADTLQARRSRRAPPPPQRPILRGQGLSYRRTKPPFPWALLALLVIAIGGLVSYGIFLSDQNSTDLAEEYFAIADQRLADVAGATDEATAIERLEIASEAIDEVRASPEVTRSNVVLWTRYLELQRAYERSLAAVQRLTFFDEPEVLASHPLPGGQFSTVVVPPPLAGITDTAVLEGLNYIYALDADAQNARLYRIPRDGGAAEAHLSPNQTVGTTVVGPLRATLWRIDQTVAVDESPSGFGYYFRQGQSWNYSKLGASEIWNVRDRLDIEEYLGNLYIWGAEPNEILRFNSGFYGDPPDYWINRAALAELDLSTVVDMAVDGSIYLLRANGSVMVLQGGIDGGTLAGEIKPDGISPPISTVTRFALTGTPEQGSIYMLEPINERIIQMDRVSGRVVQQIKMRPDGELRLDILREFTVDDSGARPTLYLINGGQLIRAQAPPPPRAFNEGREGSPVPTGTP